MATKTPDLSPDDLFRAVRWGLLKTLEGKAFAQTGTMSTTRPRIEQIIKALGGRADSNVTVTTTYLIVPGEDGYRKGGKFNAASRHGTMIITEAQFCEMIFPSVEELLGDNGDGRTT